MTIHTTHHYDPAEHRMAKLDAIRRHLPTVGVAPDFALTWLDACDRVQHGTASRQEWLAVQRLDLLQFVWG